MLRITAALLTSLAVLATAPATAGAADVWVRPGTGSDRAAGTRAAPLRTVTAAWARATPGTTIHLLPGTTGEGAAPVYWERRRRVRIVGHGPRARIVLPSLNMFRLSDVSIEHVTVRGDVHCELCTRWTLRDVRIRTAGAQEALKVNQSSYVTVADSDLSGASQNALDFVAVQHAEIRGNRIHDAEDWCAYVKGGSAYVRVHHNELYDCGTGGFTAGQGSGLQYLVAPWLHYEAYDVRVYRNDVHDTDGAGLGVNGGYDVVLAHNRLRRVGARSHAIEVVHGSRSCDGVPGDEGRERCAAYLARGAWGTTALTDGDNHVRIPNRHVFVVGNSVLPAPGAAHVWVADPYATAAQAATGAPSPALADDDLRLVGNTFDGSPAPPVQVPDFGPWEALAPPPATLSNRGL